MGNMSNKIYVLSILMLLIGITLPIMMGYLSVSKEQLVSIATTPSITIENREHENNISLEKGYEGIIRFIENNRKMLLEVQQILGATMPIMAISNLTPSPLARETFYPTISYSTTSVSKTNVQVEGIDEADIVKNNDKIIVIALQNRVYIFDVVSKRVASVINITEPQSYAIVKGLYLYGDRLIVITLHSQFINYVFQVMLENSPTKINVKRGLELSSIYIFDLSNIYSPIQLINISVYGSYLDSRLSENYLYVIATENIYSNDNDGYIIPLIDERPIEPNRIIAIDELPMVYTIILAIDLKSLEYRATAYMTDYGFRIYMSRNNNLYIASPATSYQKLYLDAIVKFINISLRYLPSNIAKTINRYVEEGEYSKAYSSIVEYLSSLDYKEAISIIEKINSEFSELNYSYVDETRFYIYTLDGIEIRYRGMFKVNGSLLDQFCMEEYGDRYFIVATTSTEQIIKYKVAEYIIAPPMYRDIEITICFNSICTTTTIPIEKDRPIAARLNVHPIFFTISTSNNVYVTDIKNLEIIGLLKGLAEGERIYAARLVKNTFFLVTFRQVDPLFAIDVTDPTNPVVLGYLKIPGFSEYLHPLVGDLLLGIGLEDGALKISLFNVSDPKEMAEVSLIKISNTWSSALQDHHAVTVYIARNITVIPVHIGYGLKQGFIIVSHTNARLNLEDIIDHEDPLRSVYIGGKLFTVSSSTIKIYNLDIKRIEDEIKIS